MARKPVTVSLPEALVKEAALFCKKRAVTLSEVTRDAIRDYFYRQEMDGARKAFTAHLQKRGIFSRTPAPAGSPGLKIVLDTSVLIAAFYRPLHRPCFSKEVYDYATEQEYCYISPYILNEFRRKCSLKLKLSDGRIRRLERLIQRKVHVERVRPARWVLPDGMRLRDEKDHPIVDLAISVHADLLLTWDKDLLILKKVGHTQIVTPRSFWDLLES